MTSTRALMAVAWRALRHRLAQNVAQNARPSGPAPAATQALGYALEGQFTRNGGADLALAGESISANFEPGACFLPDSPGAGDLGGEAVMRLPAPFLSTFAFWRAGSRPTEHEWLSAKRLERGSDPRNPFAREPLWIGFDRGAGVNLSSHFAEVDHV